jgi:DNA topoisomerase-1
VDDHGVRRVIDAVAHGRPPQAHLLSFRDQGRWRTLQPGDINAHIRELFGLEVTAKDFRTWHATVTVAAELGSVERARTQRGRASQVRAAMGAAAELLGNTVTVARSAYVDPRVVDLFEDGRTIEPVRGQDALDRAVVRLLTSGA